MTSRLSLSPIGRMVRYLAQPESEPGVPPRQQAGLGKRSSGLLTT